MLYNLVDRYQNDEYRLPEDDIHHSHRRGNLKSYRYQNVAGASSNMLVPL
jgi:hypothetical protein